MDPDSKYKVVSVYKEIKYVNNIFNIMELNRILM